MALKSDINEEVESTENETSRGSLDGWDGDLDPRDPMNWTKTIGNTIVTPAVPQILTEFHRSNPSLASFVISVPVIGFAISPLLVSPASEIWGRSPLMHISNILFLCASIMSALSTNLTMLIAARLIMGIGGCIPVVLEGGYIADLVPLGMRGKIIAVWSVVPILGTVIGPIMGGYLAAKAGWRWAYWSVTILSAAQCFACVCVIKETFAPVILLRKKPEPPTVSWSDRWAVYRTALARPLKLVTRSPIVAISTLNLTIAYVYSYLLVTTFPPVFGHIYGFDSGQIGLVYLSPALGALIGMPVFGSLSDWNLGRQKRLKDMSAPENRLISLLPSNVFIAAGMIWYGWSAEKHLHWMMPLTGAFFINLGISGVFMSIQSYLTDSFGSYVASAMAANIVIRSILAAFLPLATPLLYIRLGYGWGNTIFGFIALACCLSTPFFTKFGELYRNRSKVHVP
ncbi:polyamine transporter 1 [Penicillium longicatenatum]|nr:polyamine transporter 1 [Penicillium longicatenatum]